MTASIANGESVLGNAGSPASAGALMGSPPPGASGGSPEVGRGAHCARLRAGVLKGLAGAWRGWAGGLPPALHEVGLSSEHRPVCAVPSPANSEAGHRQACGLKIPEGLASSSMPAPCSSASSPQTSLLWDEFLFFWK